MSSATRRLLPMPGTPTSVTSCAVSSLRQRASASSRRKSSRSRPTSSVSGPCSTSRAEPGVRADHLPRRDRLRLALRVDRLRVLVVDDVPRRAPRRLADEDAVDRRGVLEARGRVDHVARDDRLAERRVRVEGDERLARVDGGADLEVVADRVADRERGEDGADRVVLVRDRRAEHGHDRVADELLHRAAAPFDLLAADVCSTA